MLTGLLLLLCTGVGWAGLAAVVSAGRIRHAPIMLVQPISAVLILLAAGWSFFVFGGVLPEGRAFYLQIGCLIGAGAANYFMLILVQKAMESGRGGVVWSFTQSSMICPFLMGMTMFGEPPAPGKIGGILFILSALILFSFSKENKGKSSSGKWLIATMGAFALSGSAQCFASLPSYYQLAGMTAMRRMLIMQTGIVLAYLLDRSPRKFSGRENLCDWYCELGKIINGWHFHQVTEEKGVFHNHKNMSGFYEKLISLGGWFMADMTGQLSKAPVFLEIRTFAGCMESWSHLTELLK